MRKSDWQPRPGNAADSDPGESFSVWQLDSDIEVEVAPQAQLRPGTDPIRGSDSPADSKSGLRPGRTASDSEIGLGTAGAVKGPTLQVGLENTPSVTAALTRMIDIMIARQAT